MIGKYGSPVPVPFEARRHRDAPIVTAVSPILSTEALIMVIDGGDARGRNLKELLEFMDAPRVAVADPANWRERLGGRRLAAIFIGDDLPQTEFDRLIREVGEFDPNTPIVRVSGDERAGAGGDH